MGKVLIDEFSQGENLLGELEQLSVQIGHIGLLTIGDVGVTSDGTIYFCNIDAPIVSQLAGAPVSGELPYAVEIQGELESPGEGCFALVNIAFEMTAEALILRPTLETAFQLSAEAVPA